MTDSLGHYTKVSLGVHTAILVLAVGINYIKYSFKKGIREKNLILLSSSVRVDTVAMPRMTVKELKAVGAHVSTKVGKKLIADGVLEEETQAAKESDGPSFLTNKKINLQKLLKKYSGEKAVKKLRAESKRARQRRKASSDSSDLQKLILAGNRLSKGKAITGDVEGSSGELADYLGTFPDLVRVHWKLPAYLANKGLKCRIRIFLSSSGDLLKAEIFESSGEEEYDRRALRAVQAASPYPAPPATLRSRAVRGDIVLGFPL